MISYAMTIDDQHPVPVVCNVSTSYSVTGLLVYALQCLHLHAYCRHHQAFRPTTLHLNVQQRPCLLALLNTMEFYSDRQTWFILVAYSTEKHKISQVWVEPATFLLLKSIMFSHYSLIFFVVSAILPFGVACKWRGDLYY